jgi:hypothetical protein
VAEVARVDVDGGFDLDTGDPAVGGFDDDVDFTIVGVSVVAESHLLLGPGRLLDQFHEDEGFQELPHDRRGRVEQAVRVTPSRAAARPVSVMCSFGRRRVRTALPGANAGSW